MPSLQLTLTMEKMAVKKMTEKEMTLCSRVMMKTRAREEAVRVLAIRLYTCMPVLMAISVEVGLVVLRVTGCGWHNLVMCPVVHV